MNRRDANQRPDANEHPRDGATAGEEEWIEHVRDAYAPPPMSLQQRRAFDERLDSRLARQRRSTGIWVLAPTAVAIAVAAFWFVQGTPPPEPAGEVPVRMAAARAATARALEAQAVATLRVLESELLAADAWSEFKAQPASAILPSDYQAIGGVVFSYEY